MKLISFNINGLRARPHQMEALIRQHQPDLIGLQETKTPDELFPLEHIQSLGYHAAWFGQKSHYGVALVTREPLESVQHGYPFDEPDAQRRLIVGRLKAADGSSVTVLNGYFPQGENRSHPLKFPAKQKFYADLMRYLQEHHDPSEQLVIMGDFNISPQDLDIGIGEDNRKRWLREGKCSFLPEEREWFGTLLEWGLVDTYRQVRPDANDRFSWFDYRSRGFEREPRRGLRIDTLLVTRPMAERLVDSDIDYEIRAMDKPSDHCPVWAQFRF